MIVDLISKCTLVGFILLCDIYYYSLKGLVCYVYLVYNPYTYDELSIYVLCILSQDTPADNNLLLLYFDLQEIGHFIMFYL